MFDPAARCRPGRTTLASPDPRSRGRRPGGSWWRLRARGAVERLIQLGKPRASISSGGGKERSITTSLSPSSAPDTYATGRVPGSGTFFCVDCGSQLSLEESERLPECSHCGASIFRRDSIFEPMQDHRETTVE